MAMTNNSKTNGSLIPAYGAHVPEDKDQRLVVTPYGEAVVVRTFRNPRGAVSMQEMNLSWTTTLSTQPNRPATLYSPTVYPSVPLSIGCDVTCLFGRGRVVELRTHPTDGTTAGTVAVVRLSSWRLAHRSRVTCYLNSAALDVVRPYQIFEMSVVEKIEHANQLKQDAAVYFGRKEYSRALQIYAKAVDAVKFVQHSPSSTNAVRADLLVVMMTCSNNAATCCLKLEQWDKAHKHAEQALSLIDALEAKKGYKIHDELMREGFTDVRVFGEWKVKSLLILAHVRTEADDIESAVNVIRQAREVIAIYVNRPATEAVPSIKQLQSNEKELIKLLSRCKERRKVQLKREKQRALAMFASNAKDTSPATTVAPSTPTESDTNKPTTEMPNSNGGLAKSKKAPRTVTFADVPTVPDEPVDKDEIDVAWHQDPFFLGGLGFLVGIVGTILLVSQRTRRNA